jgi:hypothetical protein
MAFNVTPLYERTMPAIATSANLDIARKAGSYRGQIEKGPLTLDSPYFGLAMNP